MRRIPTLVISLLAATAAGAAWAAEPPAAPDGCVGKFRLRGSLFDFESMTLQPGVKEVLDEVARVYLARCPTKVLVIESHATDLPTPELNQELSELRARGVLHELLGRGVPADHMRAVGMGSAKPEVAASDLESRKLNRRLTFRAE